MGKKGKRGGKMETATARVEVQREELRRKDTTFPQVKLTLAPSGDHIEAVERGMGQFVVAGNRGTATAELEARCESCTRNSQWERRRAMCSMWC
jgi:hypothetical protein